MFVVVFVVLLVVVLAVVLVAVFAVLLSELEAEQWTLFVVLLVLAALLRQTLLSR